MSDYDFNFVRRPQDASEGKMVLTSDEEYQRWITDTPRLNRQQATRVGRLLYGGIGELDPLGDVDVDIAADGPTADGESTAEPRSEHGTGDSAPGGDVSGIPLPTDGDTGSDEPT